jgi:hypothetical protein
MTPFDKSKLLAWTTRLVALRAAAKGTTKYQEALHLKAETDGRAEKRQTHVKSEKKPDKLIPGAEGSLPSN